jgi:hypothetical protein
MLLEFLIEIKIVNLCFKISYLRYVTINEIIKDFYMTMKIDIKEQYLDKFEDFINSLPKDAVVIKKSLDDEINKRVEEYKSGNMKTVPFGTGLDRIRKKQESQI